jgi:hypothetical protein
LVAGVEFVFAVRPSPGVFIAPETLVVSRGSPGGETAERTELFTAG